MPLFNRRRQLPSDQFSHAEGNAMIPRWTRPPERNTYDWMKMFSKSPRLAVVERIASDLSFATGKLYVVGSDGEESEITRHSFLNFWAQPNPLHEFSAAALWRLEEIYLLLKGEGYFVIEKRPRRPPGRALAGADPLGDDDAVPRAPLLHRQDHQRQHHGSQRG